MIPFDFVIFLDVDWESNTQKNRQHFLIAELAKQVEGCSKVLVVERPICPWTAPFRKRKKFIEWLRHKRGLRRTGNNLYIYTPFVFIHNIIASRIPGMTMLNRRLMRALLGQILRKTGFRMDNLISWIHHPYQLEDVQLLSEKFLVYDCYDDYIVSESSPHRKRDLEEREQIVLKHADRVLAASEELLRAKGKTNKNVRLIPNGVEFEHFASANGTNKESTLYGETPVLGFTGKITPRLDFQMLAQLTANNPNWKLAMIGPNENDAELVHNPDYRKFVSAPNVRLLGPKSYQELPSLMCLFDVCLLPYSVDNPFNISSSPLKLYEYLATGKPIVSTDLPAVRLLDGLVRIAKNAEEFEQKVAEALQENNEILRRQRLKAARENSWDKRANEIIALIKECL